MKRDDNPILGKCRDFECPTLILALLNVKLLLVRISPKLPDDGGEIPKSQG